MNLSEPFIKRPVMTTLIMVSILLFGIFAYKTLPVSDLPNIDYPTITVTAIQPGGSPEYMADLIATPLERNFAAIPGLDTMTSNSIVGQSQIVLNFSLDVDIDSKQVEVQAAITTTLPDLPPMPNNPTFEEVNPSNTPIIFMMLTTNMLTLAELYDIGYNILAQPISMIEGISQVVVYGYPYAVRVQADPMNLAAHKIDLNTLANSLIASNPNLPAGLIQGRYKDFIIQSFGMLSTGKGYDNVIVKENEGSPLYVKNVATSLDALDQREPFFRYVTKSMEQNTIVLAISRLPGSNTIAISDAVFERLPQLKKNVPASVDMKVFYDKSRPILDSVHDVELTLLIAVLLVVIVIFIYLGKLVDTLIPSITLPLTIFGTFIALYVLGFSLDNLSLLALTLAIGFIVDDSIVVLENIVRHTEKGEPAYAAAMEGSRQISLTVMTMTLALSSVFIPFIWMPGILGKIFHEFSLTIVIAIFVSGFIALTLNPMLCSRYLSKSTKEDVTHFSKRLNAKLVGWYERALIKSIQHKFFMVMLGVLSVVLTIVMIKLLPTDFIPPGNSDMIQGLIQCMEGSSKQNTIRHQIDVGNYLKNYPHQNGFVTIGGYPTDDQGVFFMHLTDPSTRPTATEISEELFADLADSVVGVNVFLKPFPVLNLQIGNSSSLGNYQYSLSSADTKALYKTAEIFLEKLKEIPELTGVNSDMRIKSPQLNLQIDRDRAGIYNITAQEIESTLQYAYSGGRIATFSKGINLYDLILEVAPGYDLTTKDLDLLYIKSSDDEIVPLTSVASWKEVVAPSSINHLNTFPSVTISFNLVKDAPLGPVLEKIKKIAKETLPRNVLGTVQGTGQVFLDTFKAMGWLILVAILVIYLLLGILYESFIHPLTILSGLPVATLGGLLTLWIFNLPLSLFSAVGLIVLIGLVQKNGIMMIDFALDYLKKPKETPEKAIVEACKVRFRPIIMTTLAAMVGALPIALGLGGDTNGNRPLGLVVFGGLLFSQLITLFVTPAVFLYMQKFQDFFSKKTKKV